jgi:hypothetical protein
MRALFLISLSLVVRADDTLSFSGRVIGGSGKHTMHVILWNAEGFLDKPVQELKLPAGASEFKLSARRGRWAVSAYEDQNENGALDLGAFGPKEPNGFSRPFKAWRKPRFDDVSFVADRDLVGLDVVLR